MTTTFRIAHRLQLHNPAPRRLQRRATSRSGQCRRSQPRAAAAPRTSARATAAPPHSLPATSGCRRKRCSRSLARSPSRNGSTTPTNYVCYRNGRRDRLADDVHVRASKCRCDVTVSGDSLR